MQYDTIDMISGRIYCPSTDEEIFTLEELAPINQKAKAVIAAWFSCVIDQPVFNHEGFKKDWESFFDKYRKETKRKDFFDLLTEFLEEYETPEWRVYEVHTSGLACGPVFNTDWYVVLADTVIEDNESE
jgi:hypothetical protein